MTAFHHLPHEMPIAGAAQSVAQGIAACVPVLRSDRLTLCAPRLEDFGSYAAIACSARADSIGGPTTRDQAWDDFMRMVGLWLLRGHGVWTIEDRFGEDSSGDDGSGDDKIGAISPSDGVLGFALIGFEPGDLEPELGYFTVDGVEGRGIATEAARLVLAHAFGPLGLRRLVSYIHPHNAASIAVARRLGAVLEGEVEGCQVWVHTAQGAA